MNNISEKDYICKQLNSNCHLMLCIGLQVVMTLLLLGGCIIVCELIPNDFSQENTTKIIISIVFLLVIGLGLISLSTSYMLRMRDEYERFLLMELRQIHDAEAKEEAKEREKDKAKEEDELLKNKHLLEFVEKFIEKKDDIEKVCKREQLVLLAKIFKADLNGSLSNNAGKTE